jgi:O-antigen/teichoic acid export membrane protein
MIARSLASLAIRVAGAATSFGFQILLARLLGSANLGVYHTANALSQIVATVGRRGLDGVLVRRGAVSHGEGQLGQTQSIASTVLGTVFKSASLAVVLMIAVVVVVGGRWLDYENGVLTLVIFLVAALPVALVSIYGEAFKAVGRPLASAAVQGLAIPLLNLVAVAVLAVHLSSAGGASALYLLSALLATGAAALAWRSLTRRMGPPGEAGDLRQLKHEALPFFVASMASILAASADLLILSFFATSEEVGIYAIASRIAVLFALISVGVNGVVAPMFAQRASADDKHSLRILCWKACAMTAVAGLPLLLASLFFPEQLLSLFGPEFTKGALILQLVVAGRYVNLISGPLGHMLQMAGWASTERNLLLGMTVVLVSAAIPLAMAHGAPGAALAACIAWAGLGVSRLVVAVILIRSGTRLGL